MRDEHANHLNAQRQLLVAETLRSKKGRKDNELLNLRRIVLDVLGKRCVKVFVGLYVRVQLSAAQVQV